MQKHRPFSCNLVVRMAHNTEQGSVESHDLPPVTKMEQEIAKVGSSGSPKLACLRRVKVRFQNGDEHASVCARNEDKSTAIPVFETVNDDNRGQQCVSWVPAMHSIPAPHDSTPIPPQLKLPTSPLRAHSASPCARQNKGTPDPDTNELSCDELI